MSYIRDAIHNQVLISAALSWLIAQVLKVLIDGIRNGFSAERLAGGGGMPSSHSATVAGLTTATVLVYGCGGFEFVMALFFAIIVIYDAAGCGWRPGGRQKCSTFCAEGIWKRGESLSTTGSPGEDGAHGAGDSGWNCHWRACGAVVCNVIF